jgi:hypothetical protein
MSGARAIGAEGSGKLYLSIHECINEIINICLGYVKQKLTKKAFLRHRDKSIARSRCDRDRRKNIY